MGSANSTVTAKWVKTITNFEYTGAAPTEAYLAYPGKYKLEVWGAQGGSFKTTYAGGKGGYSYGNITLSANTKSIRMLT